MSEEYIIYYIGHLKQLPVFLKALRKKKGLRQSDLKDIMGILPKTVSTLENHPEGVTLDSFFKLISALDLQLCLKEKPEYEKEW